MDAFEYGKLRESIHKYGFVDPLTVRRLDEGWQLVDGEHRLQAAHDEHLDEVIAVDVSGLTDDEAIALGIILNELKGHHDPKALGALLSDLISSGDVDDVLAGMPFTEDALKGLTSLSSFDWDDLKEKPAESLKDSPLKGTSWVERTFRLPHEVSENLDSALYKAKEGDEIEDWQALERVVADFLAA